VTVRGSGFCASKKCGRVRIQIYTTLAAKGIRVSSRGTFVRRHVQIPGGTLSGQVGVIASQRLANGKQLGAFAVFEILITGRSTRPPATTAAQKASSGGGAGSPTRPVATTSTTPTRVGGDLGQAAQSRRRQSTVRERSTGRPESPSGAGVASSLRTGRRGGNGFPTPWVVAGALALGAVLVLLLLLGAGFRRRRGPAALP